LASQVDENAFLVLASVYAQLNSENRSWLLELGVRRHPLAAIPVLREGLKDSNEEVVLAALAAIAELGPAKALFSAEVTPLVESSDMRIRIAAIHAGANMLNYSSLLSDESNVELVARVLERYTQEADADPTLIEPLLSSGDWRIRGAASAAFVRLGPAVKPVLHAHALSPNLPERVAATQALVELCDYEWLELNALETLAA
jgi:HEAT repeat protein